ncbi:hypothetical protein [Aporhodopirellula aestuarii]|uniref:Uncharacterized protein n=1 Tax=Aporhodopirellula aestuarii TaxID=2950107 RepID=A0ABT0UD69_9BACT|nr:hypothetical protein [Aporhodopirellula aestuarii]MCM2374410.1 hypothetical protein [Aporhodopirellula aestuarii]
MKNNTFKNLLLAGIVGTTLSGCSTFQKKDDSVVSPKPPKSLAERMPWAKSKSDQPEPYPNPVKLASTWTPDTLTQAGRVPTRGFGARMFFYDEKSRAVPVDGTLVVLGFDENAKNPDGSQAVKRFEFTPEQFTRHFSQSDLGASYSVWIPWDAVGGKQTRVSLVASFVTKEGKPVQGSPTTVLLPGTKDSSAATLAQRYSPEFRQWQLANAGNTPPTSGLMTTTIHRSAPVSRQTMDVPSMQGNTPQWNIAAANSSSTFDVAMKPSATDANASSQGTQAMPASAKINR